MGVGDVAGFVDIDEYNEKPASVEIQNEYFVCGCPGCEKIDPADMLVIFTVRGITTRAVEVSAGGISSRPVQWEDDAV